MVDCWRVACRYAYMAVSSGQCTVSQDLLKHFSRSPPAEGLTWPLVEQPLGFRDLLVSDLPEVRALWEEVT